jgi:hypothetical protein
MLYALRTLRPCRLQVLDITDLNLHPGTPSLIAVNTKQLWLFMPPLRI